MNAQPREGMMAVIRNRRALITGVQAFDADERGRFHLVEVEYTDGIRGRRRRALARLPNGPARGRQGGQEAFSGGGWYPTRPPPQRRVYGALNATTGPWQKWREFGAVNGVFMLVPERADLCAVHNRAG